MNLKQILGRLDPVLAVAKCIAIWLAYELGSQLAHSFHEESRWMGAMLASVSGIVVLQADLKSSLQQGVLRIIGIFIGCVIAVLYLTWFPFSVGGMILSVLVLELLCMVLGIPDNGKMATITLLIVLLISVEAPGLSPLANGAFRFIESSAGALVGIVLAWVAEKTKLYFKIGSK